MMDEQEAIQQFLGDRPDTQQLGEWRSALADRLRSLRADRRTAVGAAADLLDTRIAQMEKQVAALQEEEAITRFVEDSVRVTLAMGGVSDGMDEQD